MVGRLLTILFQQNSKLLTSHCWNISKTRVKCQLESHWILPLLRTHCHWWAFSAFLYVFLLHLSKVDPTACWFSNQRIPTQTATIARANPPVRSPAEAWGWWIEVLLFCRYVDKIGGVRTVGTDHEKTVRNLGSGSGHRRSTEVISFNNFLPLREHTYQISV